MHSILSNALHIEIGKKPPLRRDAQLWSQLDMVDGIVCRKYHPGPTSDTLVVPVLPHQQALSMCHDSQAAGHQGTHKTLERIRREAYWVNMAQDVDRHCRECVTCQKSKLPMPVRSPLPMPVRSPLPMPVRSPLPMPVRSPLPMPVRSPLPMPVRSPLPMPVRSPLKHPYWTTMADDCDRHPGSACVHLRTAGIFWSYRTILPNGQMPDCSQTRQP